MNITFREAYREEFLEILQMIESRLKEWKTMFLSLLH
jgi:hypothetical protein